MYIGGSDTCSKFYTRLAMASTAMAAVVVQPIFTVDNDKIVAMNAPKFSVSSRFK